MKLFSSRKKVSGDPNYLLKDSKRNRWPRPEVIEDIRTRVSQCLKVQSLTQVEKEGLQAQLDLIAVVKQQSYILENLYQIHCEQNGLDWSNFDPPGRITSA